MKKNVNFPIEITLWDRVKKVASSRGQKLQSFVSEALTAAVKPARKEGK